MATLSNARLFTMKPTCVIHSKTNSGTRLRCASKRGFQRTSNTTRNPLSISSQNFRNWENSGGISLCIMVDLFCWKWYLSFMIWFDLSFYFNGGNRRKGNSCYFIINHGLTSMWKKKENTKKNLRSTSFIFITLALTGVISSFISLRDQKSCQPFLDTNLDYFQKQHWEKNR